MTATTTVATSTDWTISLTQADICKRGKLPIELKTAMAQLDITASKELSEDEITEVVKCAIDTEIYAHFGMSESACKEYLELKEKLIKKKISFLCSASAYGKYKSLKFPDVFQYA